MGRSGEAGAIHTFEHEGGRSTVRGQHNIQAPHTILVSLVARMLREAPFDRIPVAASPKLCCRCADRRTSRPPRTGTPPRPRDLAFLQP